MPFIFIVPVWLMIVLAAVPLLFVRRLRFLAVHVVMASSLAILISFTLAIAVLLAGGRLPVSRHNGFVIFGLFVLSLIGGGVLGLVLGIFLAHRINLRLAWWPVSDSSLLPATVDESNGPGSAAPGFLEHTRRNDEADSERAREG